MNFAKMMKQAQEMQTKMGKMQQEIASRSFEGTSGGGAVKAVATGDGKITALTISPDLLKDGDIEMLQDLVITASNAALDAGRDALNSEMKSMTSGLGLPGF